MINCLTYIGSPDPKRITERPPVPYGARGLCFLTDFL